MLNFTDIPFFVEMKNTKLPKYFLFIKSTYYSGLGTNVLMLQLIGAGFLSNNGLVPKVLTQKVKVALDYS